LSRIEGARGTTETAIKELQKLAKPGQLMAEFDPAQAGPGGEGRRAAEISWLRRAVGV